MTPRVLWFVVGFLAGVLNSIGVWDVMVHGFQAISIFLFACELIVCVVGAGILIMEDLKL